MPKTNVIKLRFLKYGEPQGYECAYYTPEPVEVGDVVAVSTNNAIVTCVDAPVEEIERFGDRAKSIIGKIGKELVGKEIAKDCVVFSKMEKDFIKDTIHNYYLPEEIGELAGDDETAKSAFTKLGLLESEE